MELELTPLFRQSLIYCMEREDRCGINITKTKAKETLKNARNIPENGVLAGFMADYLVLRNMVLQCNMTKN